MGILLVGTDFSERSDRALRRAILQCHQAGYELLLVHVTDETHSNPEPERDCARAGELLAKLKRSIEDVDGVTCRTDSRRGKVAAGLVESAREAGAELIMIGPHRKARFRDWLKGSTAEQIIARANVPLIVVNAVPAEPWRRYLFPVDFGAAARRAADVISNLSFVPETGIVIAHVYDAEAREMLGRALVRGTDREDYLRGEARKAHAGLLEFVRELGFDRSKLVVREASGSVGGSVAEVARHENIDLIILSSSNKGVVEEAMVGSVTEALLQEGAHDIMIVPHRPSIAARAAP